MINEIDQSRSLTVSQDGINASYSIFDSGIVARHWRPANGVSSLSTRMASNDLNLMASVSDSPTGSGPCLLDAANGDSPRLDTNSYIQPTPAVQSHLQQFDGKVMASAHICSGIPNEGSLFTQRSASLPNRLNPASSRIDILSNVTQSRLQTLSDGQQQANDWEQVLVDACNQAMADLSVNTQHNKGAQQLQLLKPHEEVNNGGPNPHVGKNEKGGIAPPPPPPPPSASRVDLVHSNLRSMIRHHQQQLAALTQQEQSLSIQHNTTGATLAPLHRQPQQAVPIQRSSILLTPPQSHPSETMVSAFSGSSAQGIPQAETLMSMQSNYVASAPLSAPMQLHARTEPMQVHMGHTGSAALMQFRSKQMRVLRKADFVIVNEDTAVKNAAGAITKVLSRVCSQGLSCPLYTERRTDSMSAVISVAIKAIAVAKDYVINEGPLYQVAFQPYLRHHANVIPGMRQLLERRRAEELRSVTAHYQAPMLCKSVENVDVNPADPTLADEGSELAFDIFKVPSQYLQLDPSNVPVKVTANSRVSVVSNIIATMIYERGSVVLMSAGGRATHLAVLSSVSASAKLRAAATPIDVLLLPSFMSVDTTSTLGWSSIFLRFDIVRAPTLLLSPFGLGPLPPPVPPPPPPVHSSQAFMLSHARSAPAHMEYIHSQPMIQYMPLSAGNAVSFQQQGSQGLAYFTDTSTGATYIVQEAPASGLDVPVNAFMTVSEDPGVHPTIVQHIL
ncbi:hypothetical protein CEUSTIGMA_g1113.t1 [Chlamydomonas eustigma]|uniref:Uncharacterized protein n=1 Tax=Chlamydomonas eustigma TaxID=1157962 RepID=A0A250WSN1_9CHLO|nr:hypothetical protein CEUSTIGMA_g1113.t1 [Chlamydomonas eustigma]|eukprot:GAX73662.1 hypothetical protein CEUSTIGMA_g1113.t1 [Chlamydomonas eustigma]